VNRLIVEGSWCQIQDDPTYTIIELSQLMVEFYQLDDDATQAWGGGGGGMVELLENETLQGKMVRMQQGKGTYHR